MPDKNLEWEHLFDDTARLKVFGGWVLSRGLFGAHGATVSLCFIPDPNHEWKMEVKLGGKGI